MSKGRKLLLGVLILMGTLGVCHLLCEYKNYRHLQYRLERNAELKAQNEQLRLNREADALRDLENMMKNKEYSL